MQRNKKRNKRRDETQEKEKKKGKSGGGKRVKSAKRSGSQETGKKLEEREVTEGTERKSWARKFGYESRAVLSGVTTAHAKVGDELRRLQMAASLEDSCTGFRTTESPVKW